MLRFKQYVGTIIGFLHNLISACCHLTLDSSICGSPFYIRFLEQHRILLCPSEAAVGRCSRNGKDAAAAGIDIAGVEVARIGLIAILYGNLVDHAVLEESIDIRCVAVIHRQSDCSCISADSEILCRRPFPPLQITDVIVVSPEGDGRAVLSTETHAPCPWGKGRLDGEIFVGRCIFPLGSPIDSRLLRDEDGV